MRMAQDAGDELDRRKRRIYRQAQKGGAQTAFEPVLNHNENVPSRPGKMKPESWIVCN